MKNLQLNKATVKARSKKRFSLVTDENFINLMKAVGKKLDGEARGVDPKAGQTLQGIYILPTNNVIEIFVDDKDQEKAVLFNNVDVWMTFELADLQS